ncbi:hypothetical protein FOA52_007539 [Chlamydomonas sp. UWO 241]|nr:hypothetical protein FOA52_007539 [Chlamydomonas sp. UWO 241]
MTRSKRKHSKAAGTLVARAATATESPVSSGSSDSDLRPRNRACVDETQITLMALPGALGAATYAEAVQHLHGGASNHISASADTTDAIRALSAAVDDLRGLVADAGHSGALAGVLAVVQAQAQQIASLVDVVSLLPARPAAAAAPVASAAGAPVAERPAAAGAARAASARGPSRRGGLPARVGETSLCRSHVLSIPVAAATRLIASRGSEGQMARDGIVRGALRDASYLGPRGMPAGGGVVSASFLNAKPAVGGIGVEPRRGGVLRVLFTVASDAVADTVVRSRRNLRDVDPSAAVFDVLSDREEAQHRALWPAFLAKAAGKRAQFHRARLVVDGERVPAPAC